jgi:hypothetical protein
MHQNSTGVRMLTDAQIEAIKPVRYDRKVTDGHGLYLLVTPKGRPSLALSLSLCREVQDTRSRILSRGDSRLGQITSEVFS